MYQHHSLTEYSIFIISSRGILCIQVDRLTKVKNLVRFNIRYIEDIIYNLMSVGVLTHFPKCRVTIKNRGQSDDPQSQRLMKKLQQKFKSDRTQEEIEQDSFYELTNEKQILDNNIEYLRNNDNIKIIRIIWPGKAVAEEENNNYRYGRNFKSGCFSKFKGNSYIFATLCRMTISKGELNYLITVKELITIEMTFTERRYFFKSCKFYSTHKDVSHKEYDTTSMDIQGKLKGYVNDIFNIFQLNYYRNQDIESFLRDIYNLYDLINKIQGNMEQSCTNKYPRRVKFGNQKNNMYYIFISYLLCRYKNFTISQHVLNVHINYLILLGIGNKFRIRSFEDALRYNDHSNINISSRRSFSEGNEMAIQVNCSVTTKLQIKLLEIGRSIIKFIKRESYGLVGISKGVLLDVESLLIKAESNFQDNAHCLSLTQHEK
ncbi:hypothetical protein H8356DRAFT_1330277 [Neocallimastix lanati (nom. inval.)]|nr:hypothetical protein H8356DRAFT_1330277 [Neocallimastix sp. JGI-2020a]